MFPTRWPGGVRTVLPLLVFGLQMNPLGVFPAVAAGNDAAKILLHLLPTTGKNRCTRSLALGGCSSAITNGDLFPAIYYAYLVVTNGDPTEGIAAVSCGVTYDNTIARGVDIYGWTSCAPLVFSSTGWPASGGGINVIWDSGSGCQRAEPNGPGTGVVAVAGFFYLAAYSPDQLQLIPRPKDGKAQVAGCGNQEHLLAGTAVNPRPYPLGGVRFSAGGAVRGHNPCDPNTAPTPPCLISGPTDVQVGQAHSYVAAVPAGISVTWTVAGNGQIEGSNTTPTIRVLAGPAGGYTVRLTTDLGGGQSSCDLGVAVQDPNCPISGPGSLRPGQAGDYVVTPNASNPTINWSATGAYDALITLHPDRVRIIAGETPGTIELSVEVTGEGGQFRCTRTIIVPGAVAAERTSWSRIKADHTPAPGPH